MVAYIAAGLAFTLAFGAIVVGATQGIHINSGTDKTKGIADIVGGVVALAFGFGVLTGLIDGRHSGDAPGARRCRRRSTGGSRSGPPLSPGPPPTSRGSST